MDQYVLPLLWIPGPRHYLLFSHVSKSWIALLTIVATGSFSMCSFLSCQQCHKFLLYILVTTIKVVNCFSACGPSQVCSFYLVATIQGLFFIHVATIMCRLFWSSSELSVSSVLVPRHLWLASFGPLFPVVNFWFYLIVLWLPFFIW